MTNSASEMDFSALNPHIDSDGAISYLIKYGVSFLTRDQSKMGEDISYLLAHDAPLMPTPKEIYHAYKLCSAEILAEIQSLAIDPLLKKSIFHKVVNTEPSIYDGIENIQTSAVYLISLLAIIENLEQQNSKSMPADLTGMDALHFMLDAVQNGDHSPIRDNAHIENQDKSKFSPATISYIETLETLLFFANYDTQGPTPDERLVKYLPERTQDWLARLGKGPEPA